MIGRLNDIQMKKKSIYKKALEKWGKEAQINMVYEEAGELITAISQFIRGRVDINDVIDEIVDIKLMIEQFCFMYNIKKEDKIKREREKLTRLQKRLIK